ncbi:MAG: hypothetical protein HPY50_08980 [Firmicutes bacterium]|nr:hypothetical protein [Bacillota bacterium]
MKTVYVLHHSYEVDDNENVKLIGVYSTKDNAEAAVEKLKPLPGFKDYPDCFCIDEYEIDKDHWTEDFISLEEAMEDL